MTTSPNVPGPGPSDEPLASFSQCHVGIVTQLQVLGGLPALVEAAAQARRIASETLEFFRSTVLEHHSEEERELFPAVLSSATKGAEREQVQVIVDRLVDQHRQIEAMWSRLEPALTSVAKGQGNDLDAAAVQELVDTYLGHARYEEQEFLPLSQTLLGRNDNKMAALGIALHLRHAVPALLANIGHRI